MICDLTIMFCQTLYWISYKIQCNHHSVMIVGHARTTGLKGIIVQIIFVVISTFAVCNNWIPVLFIVNLYNYELYICLFHTGTNKSYITIRPMMHNCVIFILLMQHGIMRPHFSIFWNESFPHVCVCKCAFVRRKVIFTYYFCNVKH